jgi:hypothetical protein
MGVQRRRPSPIRSVAVSVRIVGGSCVCTFAESRTGRAARGDETPSKAQERIAAAQLEANQLALQTVQTQWDIARSQIATDREIAHAQIVAQSEASRQATRARLLQAKVDLLKIRKTKTNATARGHWHAQIDKALGQVNVDIPSEIFGSTRDAAKEQKGGTS